ncbi:MAG: hypothetical protein AB7U81_15655 [Thiohalomonadaceae bacterium]
MIVYRHHDEPVVPAGVLTRLASRLAAEHDAEALLSLLIEFGELESAVTDALFPAQDELNPAVARLRDTALALARAWWRAHRNEPAGAEITQAQRALETLAALDLPREARVVVPEGYAWYGLHPQSYAAAAERFAAAEMPGPVTCIGLRSIGSSLSAVVGAVLHERGWSVSAHTLRPRGHPFDRRPLLGPLLAARWRAGHGPFLVVDEGPGLSGSSLCGVAEALDALGVADHRIVFFPSWDPPADRLRSPRAQARWPCQRKYVAGAAAPAFLAGAHDLSAGAWRKEVFGAGHDLPAVQPQHERRKFLVHTPEGSRIYRFAGLARHGTAKRARAQVLAEAGFCPAPGGLREGYLDFPFLKGTPLQPADASRQFLETVAHYLAFLTRRFALPHPAPHQATAHMLVHNVAESLGPALAERAAALARGPAAGDAPAVALDGRMLPHEWLLTPWGYRKMDALDHHADHFFPGCNDIAWDLAAVMEEFALAPEAGEALVSRYAALSGDRHVAARLPFQRAAYLAYRLGYADLARQTLAGSADGARFARLAAACNARLRAVLTP